MSLTSTVQISIDARHIGSGALADPEKRIQMSRRRSWQSGTTNGQVDEMYEATRTLAASANEDIDLSGVLADAFGATIAFVEIAAIYIEADAANTNNVRFGPAASNGFLGPFADASDRLSLAPGQNHMITAPDAGWAVTAGTGDKLNVANSGAGTGVNYTIFVIGRTA